MKKVILLFNVVALINGGFIANEVVTNPNGYPTAFKSGFDHVVRVDNLSPQPGIGWSWDGSKFTSPATNPDGTPAVQVNVTPPAKSIYK